MSTYTDCKEAARILIEDPARIDEKYGIFTELDVLLLAAYNAGGYSHEQFKVAQRDASQVMGEFFRGAQVARYGPVDLSPLGFEHQDYARLFTKIAYGSLKYGPDSLITPNGTFPRMTIQDDEIGHSGRRLGANRTDFEDWAKQDVLRTRKITSSPDQQRTYLMAENLRLRKEIEKYNRENDQLRKRVVVTETHPISREEVESMIKKLRAELTTA